MMLERPPIDWSRPIQWMNGDPATAESVQGFKVVHLGERYPKEIKALMQARHFKDTIVVHEDTGAPMDPLSPVPPIAWVENIDVQRHPIEELEGMFS